MSALKALVSICVFAFSVSAFAFPTAEVRCYDGDCWKSGWLTTFPGSRDWARVYCKGDDCAANGWTVRDSRGLFVEAECVGRGCFVDGFIETTQGRSQYYRCHAPETTPNTPAGEPNCWTHGFSASGPFVYQTTSCIDGNCRERGWVNQPSGGRQSQAMCVAGRDEESGQMKTDCFRFGWNLY